MAQTYNIGRYQVDLSSVPEAERQQRFQSLVNQASANIQSYPNEQQRDTETRSWIERQGGKILGGGAFGSLPAFSVSSGLNDAGLASSKLPSMEISAADKASIASEEQARRDRLAGVITSQYGTKIAEETKKGEMAVGGAKSQLGEARGLGLSSSRAQFVANMENENKNFIRQLEKDRDNAIATLDTESADRSQKRIDTLREQQFQIYQQKYKEQQDALDRAKGITVSKGTSIYDPATGTFKTAPTSSQEAELVKSYATKYPDAGITLDDDLTTAQQKLQTSQIYKKTSGIQAYSTKMMEKYPDVSITANDTPEQISEKIKNSSIFNKQSNGGATLDADTVRFAAEIFVNTGTMPALGQGSAAARAQILKEASNVAAEQGLTGKSIAYNKAYLTAASSALTFMVKQQKAVGAFEQQALRNADLALKYNDEYVRLVGKGGSPLVNRFQAWATGGSKAITGDPALTRFETAIYAFTNEYAKVVSGGALSAAALTDSARSEAERLINASQTPEQFKAAVDVMKQEMDNRRVTLDASVEGLKTDIQSGGSSPQYSDINQPTGIQPGQGAF